MGLEDLMDHQERLGFDRNDVKAVYTSPTWAYALAAHVRRPSGAYVWAAGYSPSRNSYCGRLNKNLAYRMFYGRCGIRFCSP